MPHLVCPNIDCACKTGGELLPCHYCGAPSDSNWVSQHLERHLVGLDVDDRGPGRYWCIKCVDKVVEEFNIVDRPDEPPNPATHQDCLDWNTRRPGDVAWSIGVRLGTVIPQTFPADRFIVDYTTNTTATIADTTVAIADTAVAADTSVATDDAVGSTAAITSLFSVVGTITAD